MKNFKHFSEYLAEQTRLSEVKIEDRVFFNYTGKGFENGHYIGSYCKWRDDKHAFSGFSRTLPVEVTVPDEASNATRQNAVTLAKKNAGKVSVPNFAEVIVSKNSLLHGTRLFASGASLKNRAGVLNFAIIPYVKAILAASVPVRFDAADDSDRGKPVKGVVWLEGKIKVGGSLFTVKSTVQISASCDFRKDADNEISEIYTLHSMNVDVKSETSAQGSL